MKAMRPPAGDQLGVMSACGPAVMSTRFEPSALIVKMSRSPERADEPHERTRAA
jgi:hypothetical protein